MFNASRIKNHSGQQHYIAIVKIVRPPTLQEKKYHTVQTKPRVVSKPGEAVNRTSRFRCGPGPLIVARSCSSSTPVADMVTVCQLLHSAHILAPSTTAIRTQGPRGRTATPFPQPSPHVLHSSNVAPANRNLDGSTSASSCDAASFRLLISTANDSPKSFMHNAPLSRQHHQTPHWATAVPPNGENIPSSDITLEKRNTAQTKPCVVIQQAEAVNRNNRCRCGPCPLILARSRSRSKPVSATVTVRLLLRSAHSIAPSTTAIIEKPDPRDPQQLHSHSRRHTSVDSSIVAPADRHLKGSTSRCLAAGVHAVHDPWSSVFAVSGSGAFCLDDPCSQLLCLCHLMRHSQLSRRVRISHHGPYRRRRHLLRHGPLLLFSQLLG